MDHKVHMTYIKDPEFITARIMYITEILMVCTSQPQKKKKNVTLYGTYNGKMVKRYHYKEY